MEIAPSFDSVQKDVFFTGHMEYELCLLWLSESNLTCLEMCSVAVRTHRMCNTAVSSEFHALGVMLFA